MANISRRRVLHSAQTSSRQPSSGGVEVIAGAHPAWVGALSPPSFLPTKSTLTPHFPAVRLPAEDEQSRYSVGERAELGNT